MVSGTAGGDDFDFAPDEFEPIYLRSGDDGRALVRRGDIPGLLDDPFVSRALREWARYRRFGLAHGNGPAGERHLYVRVIETAELEADYVRGRLDEDARARNGRE